MNTEHSRRSFFKKAGMGGAAGMALFTNFGAGIEHAVASQSLASSASALRITKISTAFATRSQRRMFEPRTSALRALCAAHGQFATRDDGIGSPLCLDPEFPDAGKQPKHSIRRDCHHPPVIEKGFLKVSDGPGIGVDLNEDGLRKIATPGIPFFE